MRFTNVPRALLPASWTFWLNRRSNRPRIALRARKWFIETDEDGNPEGIDGLQVTVTNTGTPVTIDDVTCTYTHEAEDGGKARGKAQASINLKIAEGDKCEAELRTRCDPIALRTLTATDSTGRVYKASRKNLRAYKPRKERSRVLSSRLGFWGHI